jgi:hypothetical protein
MPQPQPGPASWNEVLSEELGKLRPTLDVGAAATFGATEAERATNLRAIHQKIGSLWGENGTPLTALCLSGGGIRSATFNLGVLQRLARIGLLADFDYLSSVSGGGYIASWLRTWMRREGRDNVLKTLAQRQVSKNPLVPEPRPIATLREYSNYLTPKLGLFSGDTWAAVSIILRNLLLNWLVIVPLLAAAIGVPLLFMLVVRITELPPSPYRWILLAAVIVELIASVSLYWFRRFKKDPQTPQFKFLVYCVLPVILAAGLLSTAALGLGLHEASDDPQLTDPFLVWAFSALWCIVIPILGWSLAELAAPRRLSSPKQSTEAYQGTCADQRDVSRPWEAVGLFISGSVATAMLFGATRSWLPFLYDHPALYVSLVLPILLGIYLIARVLFVGIASLGQSDTKGLVASSNDADREWWARLSGWILLVLVSWTVVTGVCLLGTYFFEYLGDRFGGSGIVKWVVGALGGGSGLAAALAGSSSSSPAAQGARTNANGGKNGDAAKDSKAGGKLPAWVMPLAAPLFVVCVIILLSWGVQRLGVLFTGQSDLFAYTQDLARNGVLTLTTCGVFALVIVLLAAVSLLAGCMVNVNRFSMHGMYRNRLVRAYLGASNASEDKAHERQPDPFTGFALDDNMPLHELWTEGRRSAQGQLDPGFPVATRPLPIINTTLNLVSGDKLAWQQRKAESFAMTPFHCGSYREGYRRSADYGGPEGISVGTAMTISGAAANPNMGYNSSPAVGFLMAVFNVRLGAWLGNTNPNGERKFGRAGPAQAILPLFAEVFGLTNSRRQYVNLSDGGHFDNLGLYEVVLRRCRHVLVSDAGADGSFAFEDLGNAIRKIRIDFGIPIEFERRIQILPNGSAKKGMYCATARIRYSAVDGTDPNCDGYLVYVKPTLHGRQAPVKDGAAPGTMPYDVYSYSRSSGTFPHESTVDQWFSESQFESYRELGFYALAQVGGEPLPVQEGQDPEDVSFLKFYDSVTRYLATRGRPQLEPQPTAGERTPAARKTG